MDLINLFLVKSEKLKIKSFYFVRYYRVSFPVSKAYLIFFGMESVVFNKAYGFAVNVVRMYKNHTEQKREFVLSKQCLRSGTAIGALVSEAKHAQSKADFLNKMNIALKESNETQYWLNLLKDTEYLSKEDFKPLYADSIELTRMLASIVKTTKQNLSK